MTNILNIISWMRFFIGTCRRFPRDGVYFMEFMSSMHSVSHYGYWRSLDLKMPWVSFAMRDYFEMYLRHDMRVFEYGSGGSTLFFADRVKNVISVEHDKAWYQEMQDYLDTLQYSNVLLIYSPPAKEINSNKAWSAQDSYKEMSFQSYVHTIDREKNDSLDIVFIDGRARSECMILAKEKVKNGGLIILDNAERQQYLAARQELVKEGWKEKKLVGLTPGILAWDTTAIYKKLA